MIIRNSGSRVPTFALLLSVLATASASSSAALAEFERSTNQSLLWGPYRPNLYFGIRPRLPDSISLGLLWARVEDYQKVQNDFRYTCEQHEGMAGYGWDRYDPRAGGIQTIHDAGNLIDISTSFIKVPDAGDKGGNWGVRIKGTPRAGAPEDLKTTVVFSIASEAQGLAALEVQGDEAKLRDLKGMEGDVVINGDSPSLGAFKITVTKGKGNHPTHSHPSGDEKPLDRTLVSSQTYPSHVLWQTKQILFTQMKTSIDAYIQKYGEDNIPPPFQLYTVTSDAGVGNQHMVQKVFEGGFEFDVLFSSFAAGKDMSSEDITEGIKKITSKFDKRFETIFKPQAPFNSEKYLEFSKSLFSNLMGGIGYFRGDWKVDRSEAPEYDEDNEGFWEEAAEARARAIPQLAGPSELFTSIPSRPFFPRGFLWDEGFHLMPIIDWDVDLTLEIVKSWFNLIDEDGWIAREQILGEEARSKVPAEFQVQYPNYANPPTLFFILTEFVEKLSKSNPTDGHSLLLSNETASQYLSEMYPLLKRHYEWFRRTQQGDIKSYDRVAFSTKEGYRWRGRTPRHILTSGLDDYPRAQPPHPGELHVDAISWVGMMAKSLQRVAEFIGEKDDAARLAKQHEAILKNIDNLHWDQRQGVFCDSTIDQFEEDVHVCHKGYISLFPFLLGLMDRDSPKIGKLLDVITDGEELWSDHGIRSLSKRSEFYGTDENYWRSPVWMNINYLALSRLLELAQHTGPYQKRATTVYSALRKNLVQTVFKSWEETGFAWEQYNPETGAGQRTQHFTGWTSLVVKMVSMPDLQTGTLRDEL